MIRGQRVRKGTFVLDGDVPAQFMIVAVRVAVVPGVLVLGPGAAANVNAFGIVLGEAGGLWRCPGGHGGHGWPWGGRESYWFGCMF